MAMFEIRDEDFRRSHGNDPRWAIDHWDWLCHIRALDRGDEPFTGWIYFVQARARDPIKIGYSRSDVKARVANLQTAWPYRLNIIGMTRGSVDMESALHRMFDHYRLEGEWFKAKAFGLNELIEHVNLRLPV